VVWYLLGDFAYALMLAAAAALVSRQEDVGSVITPALMLLIAGFVFGVTQLPDDPDGRLMQTLSMVPLFAPMLMPMRLALGGVPAWQAALSVALMLASIPALVALAGRIYRNAVMRTGARVRLAEAWRRTGP
jgi:ABC-2 type transport system permease protein